MSNNPSLDLLTEVAEYNAALKAVDRSDEVVCPSVLVTMGTGTPPVKKVNSSSTTCLRALCHWFEFFLMDFRPKWWTFSVRTVPRIP